MSPDSGETLDNDTQDNIETAEMDDAALETVINGEPDTAIDAGQNDGQETPVADDLTGGDDNTADNGKSDNADDPLEAIQKQLADSQAFIQRQSQEIGQLRKVSQPPLDPDAANAQFFDNPAEAVQRTVQQTLQKQQQAEMQNESDIRQMVPEINDLALREEIAALAVADGMPQQNVNTFVQNPFTSEPELVQRYAAQVMHNRALATKDGELTALKTELETLKTKLASTSSDVASKIANATKTPARLNSSTGQGGDGNGVISEAQLATMSDDELDNLLKQPS